MTNPGFRGRRGYFYYLPIFGWKLGELKEIGPGEDARPKLPIFWSASALSAYHAALVTKHSTGIAFLRNTCIFFLFNKDN